MEEIIIILKWIRNIIIGFIAMIIFFILLRLVNVWFVYPHQMKMRIIEEYKSKNILLEKRYVKTSFHGGFVTTSPRGSTYFFKTTNQKQFNHDLFGGDGYGNYGLDETPNLIFRGEVNYIVNDLINDKNKGNNFSEIEKIINEKKEEIMDKGFNSGIDPESRKIYFIPRILVPINEEFEGNKIYTDDSYYILNKDKNILTEIPSDNIKYKIPEKYFDEMTKYSEINWEEYIKEKEAIIFLTPNVGIFTIYISRYHEDNTEEGEKSIKYMINLFKKFEKYYNKDTYNFAILKKYVAKNEQK